MQSTREARDASTLGSLPRPPGPHGRDKLRLMRTLFSEPAPALDEICQRFGPVAGLSLGPVRTVIIGEPAVMREMFTMGADAYRWGHRYNVVGVRFVVGKTSMIVSDGVDHARRRGATQAAFARPRLDELIPTILLRTDAAIDSLVESTKPGDSVDLYPMARSLILGITLEAFFGPRLAARADEFGALLQGPQDFIEAPAVRQLPHPFPYSRRRRVRKDRRAIDAIVDEEIALRRAHPSLNRSDLLGSLLSDGSLSIDEIHDQAMSAIGAGYDTTSAALAWMLVCAGRAPDVWAMLRSEADTVFGLLGDAVAEREPGRSLLTELTYAKRVVQESLRLHPAGLVAARMAARDLNVGGFSVKRGTLIVWSPHLAGRDAGTWFNPLDFDPNRFEGLTAEQQAEADRAWVPFGRGPHMCLGFALAQMELTMAISRLAQHLDVAALAHAIPKPVGMVVNRPVGGALLQVSQRAPT